MMDPAIYSMPAYSDCRAYRYWHFERWNCSRPVLPFCMLNPATTAEADTPDRRHQTRLICKHVAESEGYGGIMQVNLFAACCPKAEGLRGFRGPFGPMNDVALAETAAAAAAQGLPILCAWGWRGHMQGADQRARAIFKSTGVRLLCLELCRNRRGRYPKHPIGADLSLPLAAFD